MSLDRKHEPPLSADKAPYGHPAESPLAAQLPDEIAAPVIELLQPGEEGETPSGSLGQLCTQWTAAFGGFVRNRPVAAVLAAVAIGALVTRATR